MAGHSGDLCLLLPGKHQVMTHKPRTEIDLLKDEFFVRWVKNPDRESNEYWNRWIKQNPDKLEMLNRAKDIIKSFHWKKRFEMQEEDYHAILDKLIYFNNIHKSGAGEDKKNDPKRSAWIWMAASIIFIAAIATGVYFQVVDTEKKEVPLEYITKVIPKGVKATVSLPDGSVVKLNSLSVLKYPARFSDSLREVFLSGQAFFSVTKNARAPFIVNTQNFSTKVLGTSFDVRSYEEDTEQHVAVVTGKVFVETTKGLSETLTPNEMTVYNRSNEMIVKTGFRFDDVLGWKDGIIQFNDATFPEVLKQLSRWYGVEFTIEDNLTIEGRYTGSFKNESLENVLKGVSFSSHFDFNINNKEVLITTQHS